MFQLATRIPYLPDPETIARMAAEIHDQNFEVDNVDDEVSPYVDRRGGPKLLLLAIVEQAVSTLDEWSRRHDCFVGTQRAFRELRRNARTAYWYITSNRNEAVTDFLATCDATDANPDAIRERVFRRFTPEALAALLQKSKVLSPT